MQRAAPLSSTNGQHVEVTQMLELHYFRTLVSHAISLRRWLNISLFDPYRPELHYMRGPGPKWREKQARSVSFAS
jgi:hypothetical protein